MIHIDTFESVSHLLQHGGFTTAALIPTVTTSSNEAPRKARRSPFLPQDGYRHRTGPWPATGLPEKA